LVYRPPSAPANSISELEEAVRTAGKNSLLFGDFNLPDIDWEKGTASGRSADFLTAVEDNMMEQLVTFPTQVKGNTLDLVITNIPERVDEVSEQGRLGKSDHVIIVTKVKVGRQQGLIKQQPDWRKADWDAMRADLKRERILIRREHGVDEAWCTVKERIEQLVSTYVPARRLRNNNRPAWLNQGILREIRRKKQLWKKCKGQVQRGREKSEKSNSEQQEAIREEAFGGERQKQEAFFLLHQDENPE
jgi:hypothetical protein